MRHAWLHLTRHFTSESGRFDEGAWSRLAREAIAGIADGHIKLVLMDSHVVAGVGNIYASEALFRAGVRPRRAAGRIKRGEWERIVTAIRDVLADAIRQGGTTLRDYVSADGTPGYFRQELHVYERAGEPCRRCATPVRHLVQGQRSTYYCPACQTGGTLRDRADTTQS